MSNPTILFENDMVLVIDKPSGLRVHEDGFSTTETVVDWFLNHVPTARGVGEEGRSPQGKPLERSGVVHRLDAETSGVLILAKTQDAFVHLKAQFHDRLVEKEYRALVYGLMNEKWGTINRPIGRSARDFRLRSAQRGSKGKIRSAVTEWERLQSGTYEGEPFSELRLIPKTGRTHQLRVHLKAIDRPIICDRSYAAGKPDVSNNLGLTRLALHAHILTLTLPEGEQRTFTADIPQEFTIAAARIA